MPLDRSAPFPSTSGSFFGMDQASLDRDLKAQSELNDRVAARMATALSAEQLKAFKNQQQQSLASQRTGMEMAAKMMAPAPTP